VIGTKWVCVLQPRGRMDDQHFPVPPASLPPLSRAARLSAQVWSVLSSSSFLVYDVVGLVGSELARTSRMIVKKDLLPLVHCLSSIDCLLVY